MENLNYLANIQNEILLVGSMYKDLNIYVENNKVIKPDYDFFDPVTKFFYNSLDLMYTTFSQTINESNVNVFMSQDIERLKTFRKYGGYKTIKKWMSLSDTDDYKNYFNIVKKYSLLREYDNKGFKVDKIINHPKFELFKANDIYRTIRGLADKVSTVIMENTDSVKMNDGNQEVVKKWLIRPQMGLEIPFKLLNEMFRGLRLGKVIGLGFLSNEGKTRLAILLACYICFVKQEKVFFMANETDEEDIRACMLTTIINNDYFKDLHKINITKAEKEVVLGIYKDDKGNIIERKIDEETGKYIETENEYITRVYNNSEAFQNVMAVANWIDSYENNLFFFERLTDYSNENLEFKIRNANISKGIKYFIYDTLKCYGEERWEKLKQTTTLLVDLMSELKCCLWADIQLTDDTVYTDIFGLSSMNIANAKQLKHVLDHLILGKRLNKEEYYKYKIVPDDDSWGMDCIDLELKSTYYGLKIDKNRGGNKDKIPVLKVNLDLNTWEEVGYLIKAPKV